MFGMKFALWILISTLFFQDMPKKDEPAPQEPKKEEPKQEEPKKEEGKKEEPKKKESPILVKLNAIRKQFGVPAVEEDEALSAACKKHADYLSRNNENGEKEDPHTENRKKAAYSPEGQKAAANSLIGFDESSFEKALDNWAGTFIRRCQMIDPSVKKVGFGQMGKICVMDVHSAHAETEFEPIIAPFDGQDRLPVRFGYGGDDPDPLPRTTKYGDCGYPITILFPRSSKVKQVSWTLKDAAGKRVDCHTSTPEGRLIKHDIVVPHAIALIPRSRLNENTKYTVWLKCVYDNKTFEKTWTFTTQ